MQLGGANLPTLTSYDQAERWFEKIKPFTNASKLYAGMRPLGARSYTQCLIRKDAVTNAIVLTLYGYPVVTFRTDGTIVMNAHAYHTATTVSFFQRVLQGRQLRGFAKVRSVIHVLVSAGSEGTHWFPLPTSGDLVFDTGTERILDVKPIHKYRANVKETKRMLGNYEAFLSYCKTALALLADHKGRCDQVEAHVKLSKAMLDTSCDYTDTDEFCRFYSFDIKRDPQNARVRRTRFFNTLDKALVTDNHEMIYLLFIRLCASMEMRYFRYDDLKQLFINLLKFQYPHLLFRLEEVQPTTHVVHNHNAVFVRYCGDNALIEQINNGTN
jgi:hypothetical protein